MTCCRPDCVDRRLLIFGMSANLAAGPLGDGAVLEAQRQFFVALRADIEKRKDLAPERVQAEVPAIRAALIARHPTYIDATEKPIASFEAQVAQVYKEITNREFPQKAALEDARRWHHGHHGLASVE